MISWSGKADNKSWQMAGNWDTGTVPTANDQVILNSSIITDITIEGNAECLSLSIGSGISNFFIALNGILKINGQLIVNTDLLFIPPTCTFWNSGELNIRELATSLEQELLEIQGTLVNESTGTMIVEKISFSGTNTSEQNREAIKIGINGELRNEGIITLPALDGSGINVGGELINESSGTINLEQIVLSGIIMPSGTTSTPTFHNHGTVFSTMDRGARSTTLATFPGTEVFNYGDITVMNSITAIDVMRLLGDFTNFPSGSVTLTDSRGIQLGLLASSNMEFLNQGSLSLVNQTTTPTGSALYATNGATLDNMGSIDISGYTRGLAVNTFGNIINQSGQKIDIMGTYSNGINNGGTIDNYGDLNLTACGNESFRNVGSSVNHSTGVVNIVDADGIALRNAPNSSSGPTALFQNLGQLNISTLFNDVAISNYSLGIFRQEGKMDITSNSKIQNVSPGEFYMQDTINATEFINQGLLSFLPSTNPYVFDGILSLEGLGSLDYHISSSINLTPIKVAGNLFLGGTLDLGFDGGYIPGINETIDLIEQEGTRFGFFDNFAPAAPLSNHEVSYSNADILQLAYNPCGNTVQENEFLFASGNWSSASSWSLGHVPLSCEEVILDPSTGSMTVMMDVVSTEIAKLSIYGDAELTIQAGRTLKVNRNYEDSGTEALLIYEEGKLTNNGTVLVNNVDGSELVENRGELHNNFLLVINSGYNLGVQGILNSGTLLNSLSGIVLVENLYTGSSQDPFAISNEHIYIENGGSTSGYNFVNTASGSLYGNGHVSSPVVENFGLINPGDTSMHSIGNLTISGNLEMQSGSKLLIDVTSAGSPGGYDHLTVAQNINLGGGDIEILGLPSFIPVPTDQFPFLTYQGSISGSIGNQIFSSEFATWDIVDDLSSQLILIYDATCLTTNLSWTDDGEDSYWTTAKNWTNSILPLACHDVYIGPGASVSVAPSDVLNTAYLEVQETTFLVSPGATLTLHGDDPFQASLYLKNATVTNNGVITINKVATKPSIKMDKLSTLQNNGQIIVK